MSYKDLLKLTPDDLRHMTSKEIESVARGLVSVSNARLTRLQNDPETRFSPALERRKKSAYGEKMSEFKAKRKVYKEALKEGKEGIRKPIKPKITTKNVNPKFTLSKDRNKNIQTIKKTKAFLNAKTSTKQGMKDILNDLESRINKDLAPGEKSYTLTESQERRFWRLYNKNVEKGGVTKKNSDQIQSFIAKLVKGRKGYVKNESILDLAERYTNKLYKESEKAESEEIRDAFEIADEEEDFF